MQGLAERHARKIAGKFKRVIIFYYFLKSSEQLESHHHIVLTSKIISETNKKSNHNSSPQIHKLVRAEAYDWIPTSSHRHHDLCGIYS